jgi:hypothetical protein
MWGLLLIAAGVGFLLDRAGIIDLFDLSQYWPLLFVLFGVNRMIGYPTPRDFMSGLGSIFFGLWLYALLEGMYGLTWMNAWPYLLIFWGIQLVLEPIIAKRFAVNKEHHNE